MATVSEEIADARGRVEALRLDPFEREQVLQSLRRIELVTTQARAKVSEALTVLRDPALVSRMAHASIAAGNRLEDALSLLDGETEPEPGT